MRQRIISALFLLPLLAIVWFGNSCAFTILVGIVALLGIREFYNMVAQRGGRPVLFSGFIFTILFIANAYFFPYIDYNYTAPLIAIAVVFTLVWLLFRSPREDVIIHWSWTLAGIFYVGWMLSYYVALRGLDQGREWVLLVLLSTFACDSAAYFTGRALGRHRMAPKISPKKTWEGAIGGFIAAVAATWILYTLFDITGLNCLCIIVLGCFIGVFAQLGDLTESFLKRRMGVKDAGNLIPGHGGVLDRTDSLVFTGIIAYYFVIWAIL